MRPILSKSLSVNATTHKTLADFGFSQAQIAQAVAMHITVTGKDLRYRYDAVAPTTTLGHLIPADQDRMLYDPAVIQKFDCIGEEASAVVFVTLLGN